MSTLAELTADLRGLAGLKKVTETEAQRLLNEGHRELCVRSEWTRANVELGPTVADQAAYTIPSTIDRILKLKLNGEPLKPASEEVMQEIAASDGTLRLAARGIWWPSFDAAGVESVSVYPTPSADLSLIARAVVYPATMTSIVGPSVPLRFERGIRDYAAAMIYGFTEDNPELRQFHAEQFEQQVELLRRHRHYRAGRGDVRMRVEGVNA